MAQLYKVVRYFDTYPDGVVASNLSEEDANRIAREKHEPKKRKTKYRAMKQD